jgi:hypothetical protein
MSQAEAQNAGVGLPSINSSSTHTPGAERLSKEQEVIPMVTDHRSPVSRDQEKDHEFEEEDWENDPENARNWSNRKKWTTVFVVSAPVEQYPVIGLRVNHFVALTLYFCPPSCQLYDGSRHSTPRLQI